MCFCVRTCPPLALPAGNPGVPASVVQLGCRPAFLLCSWPHTHRCSDHMEGLKDFPGGRTFLFKHGKSWVSGRWATLYDGVVTDDANFSFQDKSHSSHILIDSCIWASDAHSPSLVFSCLLCKITGFHWTLMTGSLSIQGP